MKPGDDDRLTADQNLPKFQQGVEDASAGGNPEPEVPRPKRTKQASRVFPLKLTERQRETLLQFAQLSGKLKQKIAQAGEGQQTVPATWKELLTLIDKANQAAVDAPSPHRRRLYSVMKRAAKFFPDSPVSNRSKRRLFKTGLLYQFKIALQGVEPPIWRRIQVRDCTIDVLHEHIQTAMGWTNSHLHEFKIGGERYGDPDLLEDDGWETKFEDSTRTLISEVLPQSGERLAFSYEYDFGDGWEHEVLFEGNPPIDPKAKYPLCLEGERSCPPEDCGGIEGYEDFLKAILDPKHKEHRSMLGWAGGRFDPEEFNAKAATRAMHQGLPDWRNME